MSVLRVKKFYPDAQIPTRGSAYAAGYDLYAYDDVTIPPNKTVLVSTGVGFTVPSGTYGRIAPRSGLSTKGIMVNAGVIDEDWSGITKVVLHNMTDTPYEVTKGDRIAQLVVTKIETPTIEIVDELAPSERGENGFGSTGK